MSSNDSINCSICACPCKKSHKLASHKPGGQGHIICNDCHHDIETHSLAAESIECTECTSKNFVIYHLHQRIHKGQPKGFKLCVDCLVREKCRDISDGQESRSKEFIIRDICADPAFDKPAVEDVLRELNMRSAAQPDEVISSPVGPTCWTIGAAAAAAAVIASLPAATNIFARNGLGHYRVVHVANDDQRAEVTPYVHNMLMDLQCLDDASRPLIRVKWLMQKVAVSMVSLPLEHSIYQVGDEIYRKLIEGDDLTVSVVSEYNVRDGKLQQIDRHIGPQVYPTATDATKRMSAFIDAYGDNSIPVTRFRIG